MIHPEIYCAHCGKNDLIKNGHSENNTQRWFCKSCRKSFQLEYAYIANKPGIKDQIPKLLLQSYGVREIGRSLNINKNTVISSIKKVK
jgi:transposase-like protein